MSKRVIDKMYWKPSYQTAILNEPVEPPEGFADWPEFQAQPRELGESLDWALVFVITKADAAAHVKTIAPKLSVKGLLWIAYPKGGEMASIPTELNRDSLWAEVVPHGLKAVAQVSLGGVWSALRFRHEDQG